METQNSSLPLEQWAELIQQYKGPKPVNSSTAKKHASVLEALLRSKEIALFDLMRDFSVLTSGVVGRAFGNSCRELTKNDRNAIWQWISQQPPERQDIERVRVLSGVLRTSPEDAFECLCSIRNASALSKEQRERLANAIARVESSCIAALFKPGEAEYKVRKVIQVLLQVAEIPRPEFPSAVLEGILPAILGRRLHTGLDNFRPAIFRLLERIESQEAERLRRMIESYQTVPAITEPALADSENQSTPQPDLAVAASPNTLDHSRPELPSRSTAANVSLYVGTPTHGQVEPDALAWFDANIQMLAHARQFYADARQQYEAERQRRCELEEQLKAHAQSEAALAESQARLQQVQASLNRLTETHDQIEKERDALARDLHQEQEIRASLESSLQALERSVKTSGQEREQLSQRIDDHADKVLSDFRVALSSAISPLVKDLPDADSAQLAEFAPNLLIIIRQIIDTLVDRGIEMHQTAGRP